MGASSWVVNELRLTQPACVAYDDKNMVTNCSLGAGLRRADDSARVSERYASGYKL